MQSEKCILSESNTTSRNICIYRSGRGLQMKITNQNYTDVEVKSRLNPGTPSVVFQCVWY
jgi:hypothetical protein